MRKIIYLYQNYNVVQDCAEVFQLPVSLMYVVVDVVTTFDGRQIVVS